MRISKSFVAGMVIDVITTAIFTVKSQQSLQKEFNATIDNMQNDIDSINDNQQATSETIDTVLDRIKTLEKSNAEQDELLKLHHESIDTLIENVDGINVMVGGLNDMVDDLIDKVILTEHVTNAFLKSPKAKKATEESKASDANDKRLADDAKTESNSIGTKLADKIPDEFKREQENMK